MSQWCVSFDTCNLSTRTESRQTRQRAFAQSAEIEGFAESSEHHLPCVAWRSREQDTAQERVSLPLCARCTYRFPSPIADTAGHRSRELPLPNAWAKRRRWNVCWAIQPFVAGLRMKVPCVGKWVMRMAVLKGNVLFAVSHVPPTIERRSDEASSRGDICV